LGSEQRFQGAGSRFSRARRTPLSSARSRQRPDTGGASPSPLPGRPPRRPLARVDDHHPRAQKPGEGDGREGLLDRRQGDEVVVGRGVEVHDGGMKGRYPSTQHLSDQLRLPRPLPTLPVPWGLDPELHLF
jgi:hypothetical protein